MRADTDEIDEAIYTAVGSANGQLTGGSFGRKAVPGKRAAENLKYRIRSFLEQLPGELTVSEIREAMEHPHG